MAGVLVAAPFVSDAIRFRIDTNHSNIGFAVPIAGGLSEVHGKFSKFKMELLYDDKDTTKSKVDVKIDVASVDTGIDQRDDHLRTADFFDAANHPEITFKSKKIVKDGKRLLLTGDFTMRGVTREISFPFEITGKQMSKDGKRLNMGFAADLKIDRTQFGVSYQHQSVPNFVGNEVRIRLNIITRSYKLKE